MKFVFLILTLSIAFVMNACGTNNSSENNLFATNYRVTSNSLAGLTWKVRNETIYACYEDSRNSQRHKDDVVYSILAWVDGIRDIAAEELTSAVELNESPDGTCDVRVYIGNYSPARTRLGSVPSVYINHSGWYGSDTVTLHEFGHAFGLLDTYRGSGGSCQSGQPDSVMCRANYKNLQDDDELGIRRIFTNVQNSGFVAPSDEIYGPVVF